MRPFTDEDRRSGYRLALRTVDLVEEDDGFFDVLCGDYEPSLDALDEEAGDTCDDFFTLGLFADAANDRGLMLAHLRRRR